MSKKVKFKLVPQVLKQVEAAAKALPPIIKHDKHGKPLYRSITNFVGTKDFDVSTKSYRTTYQRGKEPILVNHKLAMIELYETKGMPEVQNYVNAIIALTVQQQENNKTQNTATEAQQ
jgi:hypothetical protein